MKGLLFGVFYAIQGIYLLVGMPFIIISSSSMHYYYVMNVLIGLVALLMVCHEVQIQYRVRDEPCHVHQYAEEYYSNHHEERGLDFSYSERDCMRHFYHYSSCHGFHGYCSRLFPSQITN